MELVTAVIVTRGDVDVDPLTEILYEVTRRRVHVWDNAFEEDLSVYGRYAAIERTATPLVFVQDDDVLLPAESVRAIVDAWKPGHVVCNMPAEFRHDGYTDSALVGFGACFHREHPETAFQRYLSSWSGAPRYPIDAARGDSVFARTCDVVFTTLTPRILVDVPKTDREFASDPGRMWKTPGHYAERTRMLELARKVRDA